MKRFFVGLVAGLSMVLGSIPAMAASPWETLTIETLVVQVASNGTCGITATVLWSDVKPHRPLDVTFELVDGDGEPAGGGATLTVPANLGRASSPVSNPDGLTDFSVRATISAGSVDVVSNLADGACAPSGSI